MRCKKYLLFDWYLRTALLIPGSHDLLHEVECQHMSWVSWSASGMEERRRPKRHSCMYLSLRFLQLKIATALTMFDALALMSINFWFYDSCLCISAKEISNFQRDHLAWFLQRGMSLFHIHSLSSMTCFFWGDCQWEARVKLKPFDYGILLICFDRISLGSSAWPGTHRRPVSAS